MTTNEAFGEGVAFGIALIILIGSLGAIGAGLWFHETGALLAGSLGTIIGSVFCLGAWFNAHS